MKLPAEFTFKPTAEAIDELATQWGWLVPSSYRPLLFSSMGDVFYEDANKSIHWLSTESGELRKVASSRQDFETQVGSNVSEWFSAHILNAVLSTGAFLSPGQCFGYKLLPILGGTFTTENIVPLNAREWYGFSGTVHQQIKDVPDGGKIQFEWVP